MTILAVTVSLLVLFESTISPSTTSSANAFVVGVPPSPLLSSLSSSSRSLMMKMTPSSKRNALPNPPSPPTPPISMPVWSLSCPVPTIFASSTTTITTTTTTGRRQSAASSSSMSILTFVTPVSMSPKLWAISLYKTSFTRCAFLGIPNSGDEYNDLPSISSSVTTTSGFTTNVRRRKDMGEAGVLGIVDGTVGWRKRGRIQDQNSGGDGGVGILQLLIPNQDILVPILGKKSSWDKTLNKKEECSSLGYDWVTITGCSIDDEAMQFDILPNCATYIQVKLKRVTDGGDHDVAICEVIGTGIWNENTQTVLWLKDTESATNQLSALDHTSTLYSGQLRSRGII